MVISDKYHLSHHLVSNHLCLATKDCRGLVAVRRLIVTNLVVEPVFCYVCIRKLSVPQYVSNVSPGYSRYVIELLPDFNV